jgi:hypothetical protein
VACDKTGVLRSVNEGIASFAADVERAEQSHGTWSFLCECGTRECEEWVELALEEYGTIRSGDVNVLAPGHPVTRARDARAQARELTAQARGLKAEARRQMHRSERNVNR